MEDEYELLPHEEVVHLKREIEKLKSNPFISEHKDRELVHSINKLNGSMNRLYDLFKSVNDELLEEYESGEGPSNKIDKVLEQNNQIARSILKIVDKETNPPRQKPESKKIEPQIKETMSVFPEQVPSKSEIKETVSTLPRQAPPRNEVIPPLLENTKQLYEEPKPFPTAKTSSPLVKKPDFVKQQSFVPSNNARLMTKKPEIIKPFHSTPVRAPNNLNIQNRPVYNEPAMNPPHINPPNFSEPHEPEVPPPPGSQRPFHPLDTHFPPASSGIIAPNASRSSQGQFVQPNYPTSDSFSTIPGESQLSKPITPDVKAERKKIFGLF